MDLNRLQAITADLTHLLAQEQVLLKERRLLEAEQLQATKERLYGEYCLQASLLKKAKNLSPQVIEQVTQKTVEMKLLLEENEKLLGLVAEANRRILYLLADKLVQNLPSVSGYTSMGSNYHRYGVRTAALTVDTCI